MNQSENIYQELEKRAEVREGERARQGHPNRREGRLSLDGKYGILPMTRGYESKVDLEDLNILKRLPWSTVMPRRKPYAHTCFMVDGKQAYVYLHRFIMKTPTGFQVDHINGDTLDNRKCNLRVCTNQENNMAFKTKRKGTSSKFIGVSFDKGKGKWEAYIKVDGKRRHLGYYWTEKAAAIVRDAAAIERNKEFCHLNFPNIIPQLDLIL